MKQLLTEEAMKEALFAIPVEGFGEKQTHNVNHESCPAGADTRKRLYVTITRNGRYLFYCHNCGGRGVWGANVTSNIRTHHLPVAPIPFSWTLYPDRYISQMPFGFDDFVTWVGPAAREFFLYRHVLLRHLWDHRKNLHWNFPDAYRVVYAQANPEYPNDNLGIQVRTYNADADRDKVRTFGKLTPDLYDFSSAKGVPDRMVVIVEDPISAFKVAACAPSSYAAVCMWGTKDVPIELAHKLSVFYDKACVWYDSDCLNAVKSAQESYKMLHTFFGREKTNIIDGAVSSSKGPNHFGGMSSVCAVLDNIYCIPRKASHGP